VNVSMARNEPAGGMPDEDLSKRFKSFAKLLSAAVFLIAAVVLAGYCWGLETVVILYPGFAGMAPLTALGLMALSVANLSVSRHPVTVWVTSSIGLGIAVSLLASHLIAGSDSLNQPLVRLLFPSYAGPTGLTSVATGICLALLACARMMRAVGRHNSSEITAALAVIVAGLGSLGYAYGWRDLYSLYPFKTMAIHTALSLLLLSTAMLLSQTKGWMSVVISSRRPGSVTRRQLALTATLPIVGWGLIFAVDKELVGPSAAIALVVVLMFLPLVTLIIRDGVVLSRLDDEQLAKQQLERRLRAGLEAELKEKSAELEDESRQRIDAETSMFRAQRLEAMGRLTGGIAHDFNNLLMAISGNLEFIQRKLPSDSNLHKNVQRGAQATDKGIKLTAQLLAFSRTQRLNVQSVELGKVLQEAQDLLGNALGPNINVEVGLPSQAIWVSTDPLQLELAVLNLALNARDAMPTGGQFSVSVASALPDSEPNRMVTIRVADTGTGMTPETLAKAGEPFFTTKEHGKGTGLGLAQVYGLCRQCGGDLRISSEPGNGTVVEIILPSSNPVEVLRSEVGLSLGVRDDLPADTPILLVDDDECVRGVLAESLRSAGYVVSEAHNGSSGLELIREQHYAAAVIDFLMPGMNGAEMARQAREIQPDLPIVFVSGYSDTLALDAIFDAVVLRKPFELETLHEALASMR
jgi:signal transduction histidine kinase/CheY-like chemotaxis protein